MSYWLTPIVDRTKQDIEEYKDLREQVLSLLLDKSADEYVSAMERATFLSSTANRIEGNTAFVNELMIDLSYMSEVLDTRTDWANQDYMTISALEKMRINIGKLAEQYRAPPTELPGDMELTPDYFEKVNALEQILLELKNMIEAITGSYRYAGALVAGDF